MYAPPGWLMANQPQPMRALPAQPMMAPQPTRWQAAGATNPQPPAVVRGVAPEAPPRFVLPRPEALGVVTNLNLQRPQTPAGFVLPCPEALGVTTNLNLYQADTTMQKRGN